MAPMVRVGVRVRVRVRFRVRVRVGLGLGFRHLGQPSIDAQDVGSHGFDERQVA